MLQQPSIYSTKAQEIFSVGRLLSDYETLSELSTAKSDFDVNGTYIVRFSGTLEHLETVRTLAFEGDDWAAMTKFLCCSLIAKLPNEGLEECLSMVSDIHQFYTVEPVSSLPSPSMKKIQSSIVTA